MPEAGEGRLRTILACYDGSPESERALARAAELARALGAAVEVISVAEPIYRTPPWTGVADPGEERKHRRLLDQAEQRLAGLGVAATAIERTGAAADVIAETARERAVDVIVVGRRQRGALERLLLGSVSGELAAEAPCDVLVVR